MENLYAAFYSKFGEPLIRIISAQQDEPAGQIASALDTAGAALITAMYRKGQQKGGIRDLLEFFASHDLLSPDVSDPSAPEQWSTLQAKGAGVLNFLFGDRQVVLMDFLSGQNSLKSSTSSALLKAVAALFGHFLLKSHQEKSLDRQEFKDWLRIESMEVKSKLPGKLAEDLHLDESIASADQSSTITEMQGAPTGSLWSRMIPWIVLLMASLGLFYFVDGGCHHNGPSVDPVMQQEKQLDTL